MPISESHGLTRPVFEQMTYHTQDKNHQCGKTTTMKRLYHNMTVKNLRLYNTGKYRYTYACQLDHLLLL
jgi:hypothetical protein